MQEFQECMYVNLCQAQFSAAILIYTLIGFMLYILVSKVLCSNCAEHEAMHTYGYCKSSKSELMSICTRHTVHNYVMLAIKHIEFTAQGCQHE